MNLQLQSSHSALGCGFSFLLSWSVSEPDCCCCEIVLKDSRRREHVTSPSEIEIVLITGRDEKEDHPGQGHTWSVMTALYCGFMQGVENIQVTHCASEYSFAAAHR